MRADDLELGQLLEFEPSGGVLRFAGQRALLLDALALGLLRRELIEALGQAGARAVLSRFGFAHGWRTAEVLRDCFAWDSDEEWRLAGGRLHRLQGLVVFRPVPRSGEAPPPFAQAEWHESYEAEQHLLHVGPSEEPVCWTLTGFAAGYLSRVHGRRVHCIEERCRGRGDALCLMVGRPLEEWDAARREEARVLHDPCTGLERLQALTATLRRAERKLDAERRSRRQREPETEDGLVARSEPMRRALEMARRVALVDSSVLLSGESGVGKEALARFIHARSVRATRPFLAINCAAVPEALLESELFGHLRGAFTGATQDRVGLFEAASGGTLLLDEIGETPLAVQPKLLRVLQEREVRRVGDVRSRRIDVRILAATNRDLAAEAAAGRFREDLLYRLRVIEIRVPPLRERPEDVLPLAHLALAQAASRVGRKIPGFTPAAARLLLRHGWPGNVRELQNVVERAAVLCAGPRIDADDLPDELRQPARSAARTLAEVERRHVLATLARHAGHRERAARELGIGVATLYRRLRAYGAS
jgi:DNA-binding NtrC family response regulator